MTPARARRIQGLPVRGRRPGVHEFTHTVEGEIDGVPFCRYFKRLDAALTTAKQTAGVVYDLITLKGQRWNPSRQQWDPVG